MLRLTVRPTLIALSVAGALVMTGCVGPIDTSGAERVDESPSAETPATINARELALAAENVLLEQGFTVEIDCGTDDVAFDTGTTLECTGVEPSTGDSGGVTVTITSIVGSDYEVEVIGSEAVAPEEGPVFEPAQALAGFVAETLAPSLGELPVVDCGTDDIEIFTGQEVMCFYETSTNNAFIFVTVTEFDGTSYSIDIVEE